MNPSLNIEVALNPSAADRRVIIDGLAGFNRDHVGYDGHQEVAIMLRDQAEKVRGGLVGGTYWGWLHVDVLWVHANERRRGYGSAILEAAEREARRRGCQRAHLDTMSFQAVVFYQSHGYEIFGKLEDLPSGHDRVYLAKMLSAANPTSR